MEVTRNCSHCKKHLQTLISTKEEQREYFCDATCQYHHQKSKVKIKIQKKLDLDTDDVDIVTMMSSTSGRMEWF